MAIAIEQERKVITLGRKEKPTFAVTLPKMWCSLKGLKGGDVVKEIITDNAVIVITDQETANKVLKALGIKKEGK